jgi:hypothetical protein
VRGYANVLKRLIVHASAFNLGLWMRSLFGIGTPRSLQGRLAALGAVLSRLWSFVVGVELRFSPGDGLAGLYRSTVRTLWFAADR